MAFSSNVWMAQSGFSGFHPTNSGGMLKILGAKVIIFWGISCGVQARPDRRSTAERAEAMRGCSFGSDWPEVVELKASREALSRRAV